MFDGIKILNLKSNLTNKDFAVRLMTETGEILKGKQYFNDDGLHFIYYPDGTNKYQLHGSLHKYFNSGAHNYNDYTLPHLLDTISKLWQRYGIDPTINILNNLEFGVNIISPMPLAKIFKNIVHYKGKIPREFNIDGSKGIEFVLSRYIIKIYAKGLQYHQNERLIRFEIKVLKMQFFKDYQIKINTLSDLLNFSQYDAFKTILTKVWDEILFTDYSINTANLNGKKQLLFALGNNRNYWKNLLPVSQNYDDNRKNPEYKKQRKKYYKKLSKFKSLLKKYSSSAIQTEISKLIAEKWEQLSYADSRTKDSIAEFLNQFIEKKGDKLTACQNIKQGQINTLNIVLNCPPINIRRCMVCGIDISHKRFNAKYCSKKCKNAFTNPKLNPRNNIKKKIERRMKQEYLFDIRPFIKLSNREKYLLSKPNSIFN